MRPLPVAGSICCLLTLPFPTVILTSDGRACTRHRPELRAYRFAV
jgi:hypothetical protein